MTKKFKKMNMVEKNLYVKHREYESQKAQYEELISRAKSK